MAIEILMQVLWDLGAQLIFDKIDNLCIIPNSNASVDLGQYFY